MPRKLFTRDDCARIVAEAINAVFEKLNARQIVEGIAVFPAGEDAYLVDIVIRNLTDGTTWSSLITIPPTKEQTEERSRLLIGMQYSQPFICLTGASSTFPIILLSIGCTQAALAHISNIASVSILIWHSQLFPG